MEKSIGLFILLALGYLGRRVPEFPEQTPRCLSLYVLYFALPALIIGQLRSLRFDARVLVPICTAWAILPLSAGCVLLAARLFRFQREHTGALLLMTGLGNTAFFGLPMTERFFGPSGLKWAVLFDQFGSFLALVTYGAFLLSVYGRAGGQPGRRDRLSENHQAYTFPRLPVLRPDP